MLTCRHSHLTWGALQGYSPSSDQLRCIRCDLSSGTVASFSNGHYSNSIWSAASNSSGQCTCPTPTSIISTVSDATGSYYSRCIQCPAGTTLNTTEKTCSLPSGSSVSSPADDLKNVTDTLKLSLEKATMVRHARVSLWYKSQCPWTHCLLCAYKGRQACMIMTPTSTHMHSGVVLCSLCLESLFLLLGTSFLLTSSPVMLCHQATIASVQDSYGIVPPKGLSQSTPLTRWLGPSARACIVAESREGCNAVANLCALQMYST